MKARNMRLTGAFRLSLLLALVSLSLPGARSQAGVSIDDPSGEVSTEIKLPGDRNGRTPGLVDPGNGGRSGGSRDAANPDDFSVNSPGLRRPVVQVGAVNEGGLARLIARLHQLLSLILNPAR